MILPASCDGKKVITNIKLVYEGEKKGKIVKMKKNEKIFIWILILIIVIVIIVGLTRKNKRNETANNNNNNPAQENIVKEEYVEVLQDGTKLNKSETLSKAKKLGTLEFTNIQLTNKDGKTVLLADVKNTGTVRTEMQLVDVIILDKSGKELGKVGGIISPLESGKTTQFNTSMTVDYANAYDFKVVSKSN